MENKANNLTEREEVIVNHLNHKRHGGKFRVDVGKKEVKFWKEDRRLIKPVTNMFLGALQKQYGWTIKYLNNQ